ncbi:hypothetical protein DFH29DRAFT_71182 [Suillus ampliporus]|nr:hypothetical protein DFH29DRAFT_71182 [Suillus ampliporus]
MGLLLTDLPQDILIVIFVSLTVEDILSLKQTCRSLHTIGSADYVWRRSVIYFDLPLDLPGDAVVASLSSNELRDAVLNALKLDRKWRDPNLYPRKASCIISRCDTFVDALQILPGGKWLITFQVEQSSRTTVMSLWSLHDISHAVITFQTTFRGRIKSHQAFHDRVRKEIRIAVGSRTGDGCDSVRIYKVSTRAPESSPSSTPWSIVLETQPRELVDFGPLSEVRICGDIVTILFDNGMEREMQILCFNTSTRARVVITGLDLLHAPSVYLLFPKHFAFVGSGQCRELTLYDLPRSVLESSDIEDSLCEIREPIVTCHLIQYVGSTTSLLPSDGPTDSSSPQSSFALAGFPFFGYDDASETQMFVLRVAFHDIMNLGPSFSLTYASYKPSFANQQVMVGSSGCRAVWIAKGLDVGGCALQKFSAARAMREQVFPAATSSLMPAFSGLPFNPQDCQRLAFDEVSCRLCGSLLSGQVFALDY